MFSETRKRFNQFLLEYGFIYSIQLFIQLVSPRYGNNENTNGVECSLLNVIPFHVLLYTFQGSNARYHSHVRTMLNHDVITLSGRCHTVLDFQFECLNRNACSRKRRRDSTNRLRQSGSQAFIIIRITNRHACKNTPRAVQEMFVPVQSSRTNVSTSAIIVRPSVHPFDLPAYTWT